MISDYLVHTLVAINFLAIYRVFAFLLICLHLFLKAATSSAAVRNFNTDFQRELLLAVPESLCLSWECAYSFLREDS